MNYKEMLETSLVAARAIATKARNEGRDLTIAEARSFDEHMAKADQARAKLKQIKASDELFHKLADLGDGNRRKISDDNDRYYDDHTPGEVLSFKGLSRQLKSSMEDRGGMRIKSLVSTGSQVTPAQTLTSPVTMAKPATSLLDLLPVRFLDNGSEYSYLTQVTRTNNAAPVAEGALKPTSIYTLDRVSRKLQVIAHLTEPIPEYWLADLAALEQFIRDELGYGLQLAVEDQVMNGDGEGVNLLGLLAVSGIQTQTFNTSQILTVRSAITKVEALGYNASGLALNPLDWEAIETAADAEDRFFLTPGSNPVDRAARRLWGVPVALTTKVSQGAGTLLSDGVAGIVADRAVNLQWGVVGDDFARNQVRARVEGRFGVEVFHPAGIVSIDLADAA